MLNYPLTLSFKLIAIAPQVKITDASGQTVMYVRQKALALREDVRVFADEQQRDPLARIHADRWLDWSARYHITTPDERPVGVVRREGMRSLWNAHYIIADAEGREVGLIHEQNPLVKLLDSLVRMIPLVGDLLSIFVNPTYLVDRDGQTILRLRKQPAFFEGRFTLEKAQDVPEDEERLLLTSVLMMLLLERSRG